MTTVKSAARKNIESSARTLVEFFERNGCLRLPNPARRRSEPKTYKHGYEIRLVAHSRRELATLRSTIKKAGLKPGKPFAKVNRWVQPIYGREALEQFVEWVDQFGNPAKETRDSPQ